ncbi:protein FAM161A [Gadus macrocephalus]|uniref:protein FAM161A n=1 Tax=Gadus macrocephalus TaxID=80720 RepID=UPI0028CB4E02|nr:protein FAM161A [Gadus macrocephalus]
MTDPHRTNMLVTSCLKTPVDPHKKTPLALYERQRLMPRADEDMDKRDYEKEEMEFSDTEYEEEEEEEEEEEREGFSFGPDYRAPGKGDHPHLREIFFSNQEYYGKLEELKRAHLRTMAELENMYRKKLQLSGLAPEPDPRDPGTQSRFLCADLNSGMSCGLRKTCSALELRRVSGPSSDEDEGAGNEEEEGLCSSTKEQIKNMWLDFKLHPQHRHPSTSSLHSLPAGGGRKGKKDSKGRSHQEEEDKREAWRHRVTVPQPFAMTRREVERRQSGVKTRSEVELENLEMRRQLEELSECQKTFRASPVPAHVRLALYGELQEQPKRKRTEQQRVQSLRIAPKPFSFLERERRRKEQREQQPPQTSAQQDVKPFRAQPVPRAVYAAAAGEQAKEEQLYRSIKMQMRAKEMLHSSAMPPSMLARSLSQSKKGKEPVPGEGDFSHRPKINVDVPDFDAEHRLFRKHLESRKEVRPATSCEPFTLRTSQIASNRDRVLASMEKEQRSPKPTRWPYGSPRALPTPTSSLCSSLSGSLELLPAKVTDASKKRQEAVRKVLEEKRRAEEEEEIGREKRRRRQRKLQKVIFRRAQANDPHLALAETCPAKLREFRKQDLQRKREYQQEIKEIKERVKERPLLLEQVAQRNAKTAVERRYTEALRGCGLTDDFLSRTGNCTPKSVHKTSSASRSSCNSDSTVGCRKKSLDVHSLSSDLAGGETKHGEEEEEECKGERLVRSHEEDSVQSADESYHYSDDQENFSDGQETYSDKSEQEEEQQEEQGDKTSLHVENSSTLSKASDEN